jgi:hypothetical protein
VLEIGSGTGQHAIYFAEKMPHLTWYTSDRRSYLDGINMWLEDAGLPNVVPPLELDVTDDHWPVSMLTRFSQQILSILWGSVKSRA